MMSCPLKLCPKLVALDRNGSCYQGFLTVKNEDFRVWFKHGNGAKLSNLKFCCEWKLKQLLQNNWQLVEQRRHQCSTLTEFLKELLIIIEKQLEQKTITKTKFSTNQYQVLLNEIQSLGWENLESMHPSFSNLCIGYTDNSKRKHILKLTLPGEYPSVAPVCYADTPRPFEILPNKFSIVHIYEQFRAEIDLFQDFWDEMDIIDSKTWVLEPDFPSRSAAFRRIALGSSASIQLEIEPRCPKQLPECKFLGADHVCNPLKANFNKNIDLWDTSKSLLENMQMVLGKKFPSRESNTKEEICKECGICYAFSLEGFIPDQICSDERCGQVYHQTCLYEWLNALPDCRQSFNTIFGECPYCSKAITVKMPTRV